MSKGTTRIKDQLGKDPEIFPVLNADYNETHELEEGATIISTNTLGNAWIVGTSTNAIVGTNTGTVGGGQQVVGGSGRVETIQRVQNLNNIYNESFDYDIFEDASTTATGWGTGTLAFTSGQIAVSTAMYKDSTIISTATLTIDDETNLTAELSADGGSNWESVTFGTQHTFANTGTELLFKLIASGVANITKLKIVYR